MSQPGAGRREQGAEYALQTCSLLPAPCSSYGTFVRFNPSRLTKSRYAPGTPTGSWRKKLNPVYTYVPRPSGARSRPPLSSGDGLGGPGSCVSSSGTYVESQSCAKYRPRSCTQPRQSPGVISLG